MITAAFGMIGVIVHLTVGFLLLDDRYVRTVRQHRVVAARSGDPTRRIRDEILEHVGIVRRIVWQDRVGLVVGVVLLERLTGERLSARVRCVQLRHGNQIIGESLRGDVQLFGGSEESDFLPFQFEEDVRGALFRPEISYPEKCS